MNVTEVQLDLYYNFSHPRGSVNPVDLQADATWNLCPKEQDEITGIAKIRHGKDCYYETEQRFPRAIRSGASLIDRRSRWQMGSANKERYVFESWRGDTR